MRCFGQEELGNLREVIETGELWRGGKGRFVASFEDAVAQRFGVRYAHAVNTGTSADEACLAGLGLEPGDEVICPALAPIFSAVPVFAVGAIPVFAEVDPRTLIVTPEGIEARVSERTRAVMVVHLFGRPAPMDEILEVARKHDLAVIEDCAQAYDACYKGRVVGSLGDAACFSLQQSKHVTSGDGGFIITDDPDIYKRAVQYSDTGMARYRFGLESPTLEVIGGIPNRGHFSFGHNHRMTELQAAVALAQLGKIDRFNDVRRRLVEAIEEELDGCPGILPLYRQPDVKPNYWVYSVALDAGATALTAPEVQRLCHEREGFGPGFYTEIIYLQVIFQELQRKRTTPFGAALPDHVQYTPGLCPASERAALLTVTSSVHHAQDPESVRRGWRVFRKVMEQATRG